MKILSLASAIGIIVMAAGGTVVEDQNPEREFENPVIAADWPDPAVWDGSDGWYYSVATKLETVRRSRNLVDWEDMKVNPLVPDARKELVSYSENLWAPCVARLGGKWVMYISQFVSRPRCRIVALVAERPYGPFRYGGETVESGRIGIANAIDPHVVSVDGKVWMFFGSFGDGLHRVELAADGLSVKPGAKPVHVAGMRTPEDRRRAWEGSFIYPHGGWWYLFASGGSWRDSTYHLVVGRARTIDGDFCDRSGRPMTEGTTAPSIPPILSSVEGDAFFGPGHNGEIFADARGRTYMFYHAHAKGRDPEERVTMLQEVLWDADGWPYFKDGRPQRRETFALHSSAQSASAFEERSVAKIIFDSDMCTDVDDVGALVLLHSLADNGECEVLATVSCTRGTPSVGMMEIVNAWYGRPDIPTGVNRELGAGPLRRPHHFNDIYKEMVANRPDIVRHQTSDLAPDANETYRRVLAAQPDRSVTICTVGFTTNLRRLLETKGDAFSPLDGRTLVAKKVKAWYAMACRYPKGSETNSRTDAESSRIAFRDWPTPIYFLTYEYGLPVKCGEKVAEIGGDDNPVSVLFRRALPFCRRSEKGGHAAWDQCAVLAAVRGWERDFGIERGRFDIVNAKGDNAWTVEPNGNHFVLTERTPKAEVRAVIEDLMARPPRAASPICNPGPVVKPVKAVRREIKVAIIGEERMFKPKDGKWDVQAVIDYWYAAMDREIGNKPDLVVLPEGIDTWRDASPAEKRDWANVRGDRLFRAMQAYAKTHKCYLVFNSPRQFPDGRFANTTWALDRDGDLIASYDKAFPTPREMEWKEFRTVPGNRAVTCDTDFGRLGFVTCFDLNFTHFADEYLPLAPDVMVFCSYYDGNFMRNYWAGRIQSYLIGCTVGGSLPKTVVGPSGEDLLYLPEGSAGHRLTVTFPVNTNFRVIHYDHNREKLAAALKKYGTRIYVTDPMRAGVFTLYSADPALPVDDVVKEFGLETWREYYGRTLRLKARVPQCGVTKKEKGK